MLTDDNHGSDDIGSSATAYDYHRCDDNASLATGYDNHMW